MNTSVCSSVRPNLFSILSTLVRRSSFSLVQSLAQLSAVRSLALLFSDVMDEHISPRQALCIVNAVAALLLTVFSLAVPLMFRLLCLAWLFVALRQCKAEGLGESKK